MTTKRNLEKLLIIQKDRNSKTQLAKEEREEVDVCN